MQRFLMSAMALCLIAAPVALAQQAQHGPPGQHAENHAPPQHEMAHGTMAHAPHETGFTHPRPVHENHAAPMQHTAFASGHRWHSGDHYAGSRRYVSNWRAYHLRQPPPGYEWVQDGGQFVLIAVASGVIADVILNAVSQ